MKTKRFKIQLKEIKALLKKNKAFKKLNLNKNPQNKQ